MAKGDVPPGISAKIDNLLEQARPADLSERQFCLQSKVSTSFFTDLRNGREPGIDKIERLANRAGLTLAQLVDGIVPPLQDRVSVAVALPSADQLVPMMRGLLRGVGLDDAADKHAETLAQRLPDALEQAGATLAAPVYAPKTKRAARAQPPATRGPAPKQ